MPFPDGLGVTARRNFLVTALFGAGLGAGHTPFGLGDESVPLVDDDIARAMQRAALSLLFQGSTAEEYRTWQQEFRGMGKLLSDSTPPAKWSVSEDRRDEFERYSRYGGRVADTLALTRCGVLQRKWSNCSTIVMILRLSSACHLRR